MTEQNIRELQEQLQGLGFSGRTAWELEAYRQSDVSSFRVYDSREIENDRLLFAIRFEKELSGDYRLAGFALTCSRVEIPDITIRSINAKELEASLQQVDRYYDFFLKEGWEATISRNEYYHINQFIARTNNKLEQLANWKEGEEAAKLLMFKFWPGSRYAQHFNDYHHLEGRHMKTGDFSLSSENVFTAIESYHILKAKFMNEKNFEYLKDNLKFTGFGDGLADALEAQMKSGAPAFHLSFDTEINKKAFSAVLSFRKSDNSDMYFFNSYHATLQRSNGENMDQTFYMNKGKGVTVKEAYNLLEGRAVYKEMENKEGQKYHAWLQVNFAKRDKSNNHEIKQFHEAYGYGLKQALSKFPIRDMKEPDLTDILLSSLQKGNMQAVAFEKDGGAVRMFVEANPQYKTVSVYNSELKRVPKEELAMYQVDGKGKVNGKEVKTENDDNRQVKQKGKSEKQKNENQNSLLPKKRENTKKGMGMA